MEQKINLKSGDRLKVQNHRYGVCNAVVTETMDLYNLKMQPVTVVIVRLSEHPEFGEYKLKDDLSDVVEILK